MPNAVALAVGENCPFFDAGRALLQRSQYTYTSPWLRTPFVSNAEDSANATLNAVVNDHVVEAPFSSSSMPRTLAYCTVNLWRSRNFPGK